MGRDRTLGFGSIPKGWTRVNPIDNPVHHMGLWDGTGHWDLEVYPRVGHVRILHGDSHMRSMGLWDGMGHWVLGVRMGGCMVIPRTVLPILQYDSTILDNSLQSHGT